jgi:hypothetical protein
VSQATTNFVLWLAAAIFAVVTAFAPASALAHTGHEHCGQMAAHIAAPTMPKDLPGRGVAVREAVSGKAFSLQARPATAKAGTAVVDRPTGFGAGASGTLDRSGDKAGCDCGACAGCAAGCGGSVCVALPFALLPRPIDVAAHLGLPDLLAAAGTDPPSLLDPPKSLA